MTESNIPSGWIYPTPRVRKPHFFPAKSFRSACGKYARGKSDPGWMPLDGSAPADACLLCERRFEASR